MFLITDNDNYVNELSIWAAYCIFCLAWVFSTMLAIPHHRQANKTSIKSNTRIYQKNPNPDYFQDSKLKQK
ncbi:hypothetical protein COD94_29535 [Bacillus cereus]|nr:hypothetical protein COD94_29535 [Bacillus cereus]